LKKDVAYLLKVVKTEAFSSLIRILSSQIGTICRFFFAHIWCKKYDWPLTNSEISDAAHKVAGGDFSRSETVVRIVERLRNPFFDEYKLTDQEVSLGLFEADA
jgi:hypothetical protein